MGVDEDGNGLASLIGIVKSSSGRLVPRASTANIIQPPNTFLNSSSTLSTSITSKILDELWFRQNFPSETEKITRRRTIHFGKHENIFKKTLEAQFNEETSTDLSSKVSSDTNQSEDLSNPSKETPTRTILEEALLNELKELKLDLKKLKEENSKRMKDFEVRENAYREEISSIQEQRNRILMEYDSDRNQYQTEIILIKEEKQKMEADLAKALKSLEIELNSSKNDFEKKSLKEMAEKLDHEITQLKASFVDEIERTLSDRELQHTEEVEVLENEKHDLEEQLNDTKNELQYYEKSLTKVLSQLADSQDRLEGLEVEKKDLEIRAVENEIAYLDLEEDRDVLQNQCSQLKRQLETLLQENSESTNRADIEMISDKSDSLRQQYFELQQECDMMEKEVGSLKDKKAYLLWEASELSVASKPLENTMSAGKDVNDQETEENHFTPLIQEDTVADVRLKKNIDSLEENHESLEQQYINLQKSIEELNEVISREVERINTLHEDKKSLADEIDALIQLNEELRSKAEFWRTSVKEVESELSVNSSTNSKRSRRNSNSISFSRIQEIYEQRLTDQERRFNRLWDDIVINNEHLQNENQNLQYQLSDIENDRDSWAKYANELETRVEILSRESRQIDSISATDLIMNPANDELIRAQLEDENISQVDLNSQFSTIVADYKYQLDILETDKQELIEYAHKLEYEVDHLTQELHRKKSFSRRHSQSYAPPTPSESVNQEALLPHSNRIQSDDFSDGSNVKSETNRTLHSSVDFETEGFASLFADIDQMRDEMTKLSQVNTRLQEECLKLKIDRDRLAQEMNQLVDENSTLVAEHREFLAASSRIKKEPDTPEMVLEGYLIKDPRVLELIEKVNRLELNLDNQYRANERLKQQLTHFGQYFTSVDSPVCLENSLLFPEAVNNGPSLVKAPEVADKLSVGHKSNSVILSTDLINSLLLQSYAVKEMLETDSRLLTEIQITLSPDSIESIRSSDEQSEDSRNSSRPVDRDQVTRLFKSLKSLFQNQTSLIDDVQLIINKLKHTQNMSSPLAPEIVDITNKLDLITLYDASERSENSLVVAARLCGMKGRDSGFSEGGSIFKLENTEPFLKSSPRVQGRRSSFDSGSDQMYQLSEKEAHDFQQDFQELEILCRDLRYENELLIQENQQFRQKLHEAYNKTTSLRQKSMMVENLELRIHDLIQIKDEEYAMNTDRISQLECDLQTKVSKIMSLAREKNSILQDNHELQRKLIMLSEAKRQLEVDYQTEKEMVMSFQNQLCVLRESLRLEQYETRSRSNQAVSMDTNLAEENANCERHHPFELPETADSSSEDAVSH
ncbi:hypothetical protein K7432_011713 [Basidiobolus ranarum]|uniref:Uncharacterized protein n=1 Tax=Basidiobolus ranarum TaxID=34480 RepID=A0ABR2WLZ6_9FUNG